MMRTTVKRTLVGLALAALPVLVVLAAAAPRSVNA